MNLEVSLCMKGNSVYSFLRNLGFSIMKKRYIQFSKG
jgi:hypothetical protein